MYFWLSLAMFAVFGIVFSLRRDLRRVMLWSGTLSVPVFFLKPLVSPDFVPQLLNNGTYMEYVLEALIFGFSFGGVAAVLFEVFFHMKLRLSPHPHKNHLKWLILGPVVFMGAAFLLSLSFALSIALGFLAQAAVLVYFRRDLLWDTLVSGLFLGLVYLVFYYMYFLIFPGATGQLWFADFSGVMFFSMPVEEFLAVFCFGLLWGPLYEGFKEYRLI